jgi:hypothetical protein
MQISDIVDAMLDLIKKNLIAKTAVTADVSIGDTTISVINSFHFKAGQEVVLIDYDYNVEGSPHYHQYEYAVVKSVDDTRTITLTEAIKSDWFVAKGTFLQKTIGHSPLYEENVLYGDREVIPEHEIAITVEPVSLTNEWIYIQGGLSEEYRITFMVYGKSVKTEEGMRILNKYTEALYQLVNDNLHLNINNVQTPILDDVSIGDSMIYIEDTPENRESFVVSMTLAEQYEMQDNLTPPCFFSDIIDRTISGGKICLEVDPPVATDILISEFGVMTSLNRYLYDSRVDNVTWGVVNKGSAVLRAAELNWFGKEVNEHFFPQQDKRVIYFEEEDGCSESSSSSS